MQWTVVIPVKSLPGAKSRLVPASTGPDQHRDLVAAIRADTVDAARAVAAVARVVLVTDRPTTDGEGETVPGPHHLLVQISPGLNGALRDAAAHAVRTWPDDGVAALVGDLPALRPDDLAAALDAAQHTPSGYVADASGTGTTLLSARPGSVLDPQFGLHSARRHAERAQPLVAGESLRCDVDTADDLAAAALLGLGRRTGQTWTRIQALSSPDVHDGVA